MKLTKTRIGNYLRRHMLGDQPTFRKGFKEGVAFAQNSQPLTEDQIFDLENNLPDDAVSDRRWTIELARAVERAHGIGAGSL
jgi:hypothetical protein